MDAVIPILAAIAIALVLWGVAGVRLHVRETTLLSAWRWTVGATIFWTYVQLLSMGAPVQSWWLDAAWYLTAVLMLCPPIAVLGARRPGAGVWTTFVILPLIAVLGWPLLPVASGTTLRLEAPVLVGFVLILVMGAGNYIGTKYSLAAALYAVAVCLCVAPISAVAPTALQGSTMPRHLATFCLALATLSARQSASKTNPHPPGFDHLWWDFRDMFGVVWAKRFQERFNGIATQQQWLARLGDNGLTWDAPITSAEHMETESRIAQTTRWLLRRFVDPQWIDARYPPLK